MDTVLRDPLGDIVEWFARAIPAPTEKNAQTQLGVHFEEVAEMLDTLLANNPDTRKILFNAYAAMKVLAEHVKTSEPGVIEVCRGSEVDFLDSLCDQVVTATGCGHLMGYKILSAVREVNASNWSKFVDGKPIFDENKKIRKGPDYFKADLSTYVP